MTTPFDCSPRPTTYSATAWAQRRTFWNVNSSATLARHPSVPKRICVGSSGFEACSFPEGSWVVVKSLPPAGRANWQGRTAQRSNRPCPEPTPRQSDERPETDPRRKRAALRGGLQRLHHEGLWLPRSGLPPVPGFPESRCRGDCQSLRYLKEGYRNLPSPRH